jgi:hypothetical protein
MSDDGTYLNKKVRRSSWSKYLDVQLNRTTEDNRTRITLRFWLAHAHFQFQKKWLAMSVGRTAALLLWRRIPYGNKLPHLDKLNMLTPTPNDVLSGRGHSVNNHPGNEAFRRMLESHMVRATCISHLLFTNNDELYTMMLCRLISFPLPQLSKPFNII